MLDQSQIDFFHKNGYLIMRGALRGRELEMLQAAVAKVAAEGVARQGEHHAYVKNADVSETYWRSENMWERGDIFKAVSVNPDLLENLGQCYGQAFFPWNDSLVVKLPNSGAPVPWHQDPPYCFPNREETYAVPNFDLDIYLDHSGPDNGCVYAIPGHHLVGHVDLKSKTEQELFESCGAVPLEMEAGDVLFHCLSTPHGSRPNNSPLQRRVFYIHYLPDEVFQDAYASEPWSAAKPGWGEQRRTAMEDMMKSRAKLDFEVPTERKTLSWGEGGFRFTGQPTTPPRYWGTLAAAITREERAAQKQLRS